MVQAGQYVTDGTAVFLVTDIRDGAQVGDIKLSPILRKGYVKANGALLTSASTNYPRLITFVTENPDLLAADDTEWNSNKALYVYNSSADTLRVPDATGRVLQGGAVVESVEAGLPEATGTIAPFVTGANNTSSGLQAQSMSGVFSTTVSGAFRQFSTATSQTNYTNQGTLVQFAASQSNPIYGNSTTVQPPALTMIPQIKY